MQAIDQTTFGEGLGNCFSACVASILEVSLEDVPFFGADELWWTRFSEWLEARNLYAVCLKHRAGRAPVGYHILSGKSPRGEFLHSVVAKGEDIVHDPHPSRANIQDRVDCIIIVPMDFGDHKRELEKVAIDAAFEERDACADIARDVMVGNVEIPRDGMQYWMAAAEFILDEIRGRVLLKLDQPSSSGQTLVTP